jgi:hypothetical protein
VPGGHPTRIALILGCIIQLALCSSSILLAEIIDRVLAVVAGVVIAQSDVTAARELGLVTVGAVDDPVGAVLTKLVDRQLILAEVDRYAPPEPPAEAIDREVAQVRARFTSPDAYNAALARSGLDDKRLRQLLRDDLRIRTYLDQRFGVPPPTEDELSRYYREHLDEFTRTGTVLPLTAVSDEIARKLTADRHEMLVQDWVNGLRRRSVITNLYLPRE